MVASLPQFDHPLPRGSIASLILPTGPEQARIDTQLARRIPGESDGGQRRPGIGAMVEV